MNRGANHKRIFFKDNDYDLFAQTPVHRNTPNGVEYIDTLRIFGHEKKYWFSTGAFSELKIPVDPLHEVGKVEFMDINNDHVLDVILNHF